MATTGVRVLMCDVCDDTGNVVYRDEKGFVCIKPCTVCNIWRNNRITRLLVSSGLPCRNENAELDPLPSKFVSEFFTVPTKNNWIIFAGRPGTGKTTQATLVGHEIIRRYLKRVLFFDGFDFFRKLAANRKRDAEFDKLKTRFVSADFVIIDDFLKLSPRKDSFGFNEYKEAVLDVLWARYDALKPLAFTTQIPSKQIAEFDDAFANRMFERAKNNVVFYNDKSPCWRLK